MFPGLGLGALLARASAVTDGMVEAAALALAGSLTDGERAEDRIYPDVARIRAISAQIAHSVVRAAQTDVRAAVWPPNACACANGVLVTERRPPCRLARDR